MQGSRCACAMLLMVLPLAQPATAAPATGQSQARPHTHAHTYTCPMHPGVKADHPGACPVCGMALAADEPHAGGYRLEVQSRPATVLPKHPFELALTVRDTATNTTVSDFAVVHERPFHVFVVREDLGHYEHVHPEPAGDGRWVVELSLPDPGRYKVYADVMPVGGRSQVLVQSLTVGTGDWPPPITLVADSGERKTVGSLTAELVLPDGRLVADREQSLRYRLTDAQTGRPVKDLQPYLGAWGHTLIISKGTEHFVHAHPAEEVDRDGGGPELTFHARFPEPGLYRVWTQFRRDSVVETVVYTVDVSAPLPK